MEEDRLDIILKEVSDLKDLFLRRLMDDKIKTAVISQLKDNNVSLQRMIDEKAVLGLVKELLIVCDRIDSQEKVDELSLSIEDEILEILARREIYRMPKSTHFDPTVHNAVGTAEETEENPENSIVKTVRNGYMLKDRVLRPADVIVAVKRSN